MLFTVLESSPDTAARLSHTLSLWQNAEENVKLYAAKLAPFMQSILSELLIARPDNAPAFLSELLVSKFGAAPPATIPTGVPIDGPPARAAAPAAADAVTVTAAPTAVSQTAPTTASSTAPSTATTPAAAVVATTSASAASPPAATPTAAAAVKARTGGIDDNEADTFDGEDMTPARLMALLVPPQFAGTLPSTGGDKFGLHYSRKAFNGWVRQDSPCCAAASVAGTATQHQP